jgi:lactoylglutathione lyase
MFGLELTGTYKSDRENVDEDICAMGVGPFKVEVDLMQPLDPEKKPAVHNTPLNHVGLWIDNLPVAVEWLSQQGVRFAPGGIRKGAAGFDICFIHPKGSEELPIGGEGVLIELVQAPEEVVWLHSACELVVPTQETKPTNQCALLKWGPSQCNRLGKQANTNRSPCRRLQ